MAENKYEGRMIHTHSMFSFFLPRTLPRCVDVVLMHASFTFFIIT